MNSYVLLEAIEEIDEKYITSALNCLGYCAYLNTQTVSSSNRARHWPTRRVFIGIAAAILILLASLTAMAVSEEFREFMFSIFNISSTEKIPTTEDDIEFDGPIGQIDAINIDDAVDVYYFKIDGILPVHDGIVYSSGNNGTDAAFYDVTADGLIKIEAIRIEFEYSFMGTDFNIKFDHIVHSGKLFFRELPESLNIDPYKYGWSLQNAGDSVDTVWLVLPYIVNIRGIEVYSSYPLLYNVRTCEIIDMFKDIEIANISIERWQFTDDMAYALIMGQSDEDGFGFWICDITQRMITRVDVLTGRTINDCYVLKDNIIVCYAANGNQFDVFNYDISTQSKIIILENVQHYYNTENGSGLRSIQYYGKQGRYALYLYNSGDVSLFDLLTGDCLELDGLKNDGFIITAESPDGEHVLIAFRDRNYSNSLALYNLGVLDIQTGVLSVLEREGYEAKTEHSIEWLDDNRIVVLAVNSADELYMYIYEFH
jgi:hypothetical protein